MPVSSFLKESLQSGLSIHIKSKIKCWGYISLTGFISSKKDRSPLIHSKIKSKQHLKGHLILINLPEELQKQKVSILSPQHGLNL